MRKIIFVIWALWLMASSAGAAEIGDVVGETYHTDIAAYVNNYSIPSYAANGISVIVAEDLRACGFDVSWNDAERSLTITRNPDLKPVGMVVRKNGAAGIRFMDILYTDIKFLQTVFRSLHTQYRDIQLYLWNPLPCSENVNGEVRNVQFIYGWTAWIQNLKNSLYIREDLQRI